MKEDFSQLAIDGSIISELKVVPSRKIVMTLLRGPQSEAEDLSKLNTTSSSTA